MSDLVKVVSASQLGKMMKCMRQWYYDYVLHLPVATNSRLIVGRAFHKSVEMNLRHKIDKETLLDREEAISIASDEFDKQSITVERWAKERGEEKDSCIRVSEFHYDKAAPAFEPIDVEHEVKFKVAGIDVIGYVDIIENTRVTDTKFKGRKPSSSNLNYIQSVWYPKAAREELGMEVGEFVFDCYVPKKDKVERVPIIVKPDITQEARIEKELVIRKEMAEKGLFPRVSPDLGICDYCDHRDYCWNKDSA